MLHSIWQTSQVYIEMAVTCAMRA